jgi:hypothetical protein
MCTAGNKNREHTVQGVKRGGSVSESARRERGRSEERGGERAYLQYLARMLSGFRPAAAADGERDGEGDPSTVRMGELLADAAAAASG